LTGQEAGRLVDYFFHGLVGVFRDLEFTVFDKVEKVHWHAVAVDGLGFSVGKNGEIQSEF
jgi:hypothetical protein